MEAEREGWKGKEGRLGGDGTGERKGMGKRGKS